MIPPYDENRITTLCATVRATYAAAGVPADYLYPLWIARTLHDYCAGMAWDASAAKHLHELRIALGLIDPPEPPATQRAGGP